MGIDAPMSVSVKERDINDVFSRIVNAAQQPHLNVPETDQGRRQKRYKKLANFTLMSLSGKHSMVAIKAHIAFLDVCSI